MRQLLPEPREDVDLYEAYRTEPGRPLLRVNMVASLDGALTDAQGRSGGLGSTADQTLLVTLRALADVVLVGAQTVRAESYGPVRLRPALAQRREADGRGAPPPIAVVTRSCDLDLSSPLFTDPSTETIVITSATAPPDRRRAAQAVARVLLAGEDRAEPAEIVRLLRDELGFAHILCEGGPALSAALHAAGAVDELCLTLAPRLEGPGRLGLIDALPQAATLRLVSALAEGSELFLRYWLTPR